LLLERAVEGARLHVEGDPVVLAVDELALVVARLGGELHLRLALGRIRLLEAAHRLLEAALGAAELAEPEGAAAGAGERLEGVGAARVLPQVGVERALGAA